MTVTERKPLSYSIPQLATLTGLSTRQLDKHVERGDLSVKYSGTKRVVIASEAERFITELPDEDRGPL